MIKLLTMCGRKSSDSVADTMATSATLQVIVLLMNPTSRRFEFLQLELDSDKAVSDILAAISINVTDASLKNQQYDGVVDETGNTMNECVRLVEFCEEKTVLAALPKGLSVEELVRFVRPILCDKKIEKLLVGHEFDTTGWNKKVEDSKSPGAVEEPSAASAKAASSRSGDKAFEKKMLRTIITVFFFLIVGVMYIILFCLFTATGVRGETLLMYGATGVTFFYWSKVFLSKFFLAILEQLVRTIH